MILINDQSSPDDFEPVLRSHLAAVREYVARMFPSQLQGRFDPEDVVQDTYLEAFRLIQTFVPEEEDSPRRWLLTIARNRVTELVRIAKRVKHGGDRHILSEDELVHGEIIELLQELAAHQKTPSRSASRREFVVILEKTMLSMSSHYRQAVHLRYIDGLSLAETAQRMDKSNDATKKLCMRGLKELRVQLRRASLYL